MWERARSISAIGARVTLREFEPRSRLVPSVCRIGLDDLGRRFARKVKKTLDPTA
jgi:hypothetical protein